MGRISKKCKNALPKQECLLAGGCKYHTSADSNPTAKRPRKRLHVAQDAPVPGPSEGVGNVESENLEG